MNGTWLLKGAQRDAQTVNSKWEMVNLALIHGVQIKETRSVPRSSGLVTEAFRTDWGLPGAVDQVFQVTLEPGTLSAWHGHQETTDRLFVSAGSVRIVLYDSREDSPTRGLVNEILSSNMRPRLIVVPPQVWHGVQNIGGTTACVLNLVDRAYSYESPDHFRLPFDTPQIPFQFPR